jgi:Carboxypeptidase regulatory-like domain
MHDASPATRLSLRMTTRSSPQESNLPSVGGGQPFVVPSTLPIHRKSHCGSGALLRYLAALCILFSGTPHAHAFQSIDPAAGSISGLVLDTQGALIPGAHIQLSHPDGTTTQTLSSSDGHFTFSHVPPGAFTLSVNLQGFLASSSSIVLLPGQSLEVQPIVLKIAPAYIELQVLPDAPYTSQQQLQLEETQRLFGLFPNFFVSYHWNAPPLTPAQKFHLAWKNAEDPGNLLLVGTTAGVQQAANSFNGYGQGAAGYGKRYGADLGNLAVGTFMGGAVLPSLFHQDPRYFYKGTGSIRSRFVYAISSAIICRGDNGHRQPNVSGVLGDLSAGAISNLYYPASNRHGAQLTFETGLLGVAGDALNGIFQEFVLRRLTPSVKHQPSTPQPPQQTP